MRGLRTAKVCRARPRRFTVLAAVPIAMVMLLAAPSPLAASLCRDPGPVGLNAVTLQDDSIRERQLDGIELDGFSFVRVVVEWPLIEPFPDDFKWTMTDSIVYGAAKRGLDVLGLISYAPWWSVNPENRNRIHPAPDDLGAFSKFVSTAAERYRGVIRNWEIWNEPNIMQNFAPAPDVGKYVDMLKIAYGELKASDPDATVIAGGLSPAIDTDTSIDPVRFLEEMYRHGAGKYFDAIAMHPYSAPDLLSESGPSNSSHRAIAAMGGLLSRNGQSDKKIWFTEFGASTMPTSMADVDPSAQHVGVSDERQAEILSNGINYMRSQPNCGPIFLFDYRDIATGTQVAENNYGLIESDFTPKPSLGVVKSLLKS